MKDNWCVDIIQITLIIKKLIGKFETDIVSIFFCAQLLRSFGKISIVNKLK